MSADKTTLLTSNTGNVYAVVNGRINIEEYRASEIFRDSAFTFDFADFV